MILDLTRFVEEERPYWRELDELLISLETRVDGRLSIEEARRLNYLHQRAAADLARIRTFSGEPGLRAEIEALVARSHAEVYSPTPRESVGIRLWTWLSVIFPSTVRRHAKLLAGATVLFLIGALFGAGALLMDPGAKEVLMPFPHLLLEPSDRVQREETRADGSRGYEGRFAGMLMTHNTRISILSVALGTTYGIGTGVMLFYNGAILGAVAADYIRDNQLKFLVAWLLPHGSVEIPALILAGQAGLLLAAAMIGRKRRLRLRDRLREAAPDLVTLVMGVAILLVWAGIVEAFLSQLHEPVMPYWIKITFGAVSLILLGAYLLFSGKRKAGV